MQLPLSFLLRWRYQYGSRLGIIVGMSNYISFFGGKDGVVGELPKIPISVALNMCQTWPKVALQKNSFHKQHFKALIHD